MLIEKVIMGSYQDCTLMMEERNLDGVNSVVVFGDKNKVFIVY